MPDDELPDWERLLSAERHLQAVIPGTVLVGGTAAALHAGHRRSMDADHVLVDLRGRFDEVVRELETVAGWVPARVQRPVLILGALDGVQTGIRQLRRSTPLEWEIIEGLRVPTLEEMARIKAWLLVTRHTVRDYLDTVVLLERLGEARAVAALRSLDELYQQTQASVKAELIERLTRAAPGDLAEVDLQSYKGLISPWNNWAHVKETGRRFSQSLAVSFMAEP